MYAKIPIQPYLDLLEDGAAIYLGTRDADLVPDSSILAGATAGPEPGVLTVFLPDGQGRQALDNLSDNGQAALTIVRLSDYRTYQLKGRARGVRRACDDERPLLERQHEAFARGADLEDLGHVVRVWAIWPCSAIDIEVGEVFAQTPGPGTGQRISS